MAATINFTKVSGVVRIESTVQGSLAYKSFFSPRGELTHKGNTIYITVNGIPLQFEYTDLQVNGQTPSTLSEAITLLTSIFGS